MGLNNKFKVYEIAEKIIENKPEYTQKLEYLMYSYVEKLANWYNKKFSIDLMYPSQMICGAGNFNMKRHNKQMAALDNHFASLNDINAMATKIEHIESQKEIIKSGDSDAVEKLQDKLKGLEILQAEMKETNIYFKKHCTLKGCKYFEDKTEDQLQKLDTTINESWDKKPYASYSLTNNNAKIKNTTARIDQLEKAKEKGIQEKEITTEEGNDLFKVIEDTEIMRLQLVFNGKPSEEVRSLLKSNGYRWSPSNNAWQRQLTENARYSFKRIKPELEKLLA